MVDTEKITQFLLSLSPEYENSQSDKNIKRIYENLLSFLIINNIPSSTENDKVKIRLESKVFEAPKGNIINSLGNFKSKLENPVFSMPVIQENTIEPIHDVADDMIELMNELEDEPTPIERVEHQSSKKNIESKIEGNGNTSDLEINLKINDEKNIEPNTVSLGNEELPSFETENINENKTVNQEEKRETPKKKISYDWTVLPNVESSLINTAVPQNKNAKIKPQLFSYEIRMDVFQMELKGKTTIIIVCPLTYAKNETFTKTFAYILDNGKIYTGCSSKKEAAFAIKTESDIFLIRGLYYAGIFESTIIPLHSHMNGLKKYRPNDSQTGHSIVELNNRRFHVLPLSTKNQANGTTSILVCTENLSTGEFDCSCSNLNGEFQIKETNNKIIGKWDTELFEPKIF